MSISADVAITTLHRLLYTTPDTRTISLHASSLTQADFINSILPLLQQFTHVEDLDLSENHLEEVDHLSVLTQLTYLDLRSNPQLSARSHIHFFAALPHLTNLNVTLRNGKEDEMFLLMYLPKLKVLNERKIVEGDDGGRRLSDEVVEKEKSAEAISYASQQPPPDITLTGSDLEPVATLFDSIRSLIPAAELNPHQNGSEENGGDPFTRRRYIDTQLSTFETYVSGIVSRLNTSLSHPSHTKSAIVRMSSILEARHQLYDVCSTALISHVRVTTPQMTDCVSALRTSERDTIQKYTELLVWLDSEFEALATQCQRKEEECRKVKELLKKEKENGSSNSNKVNSSVNSTTANDTSFSTSQDRLSLLSSIDSLSLDVTTLRSTLKEAQDLEITTQAAHLKEKQSWRESEQRWQAKYRALEVKLQQVQSASGGAAVVIQQQMMMQQQQNGLSSPTHASSSPSTLSPTHRSSTSTATNNSTGVGAAASTISSPSLSRRPRALSVSQPNKGVSLLAAGGGGAAGHARHPSSSNSPTASSTTSQQHQSASRLSPTAASTTRATRSPSHVRSSSYQMLGRKLNHTIDTSSSPVGSASPRTSFSIPFFGAIEPMSAAPGVDAPPSSPMSGGSGGSPSSASAQQQSSYQHIHLQHHTQSPQQQQQHSLSRPGTAPGSTHRPSAVSTSNPPSPQMHSLTSPTHGSLGLPQQQPLSPAPSMLHHSHNNQQQPLQAPVMSQKQLKDLIQAIYESYDHSKSASATGNAPTTKQTLLTHMHTYFQTVYQGDRTMILSSAATLLHDLDVYSGQSASAASSDGQQVISIFSDILHHNIDESFRFIYQKTTKQVTDALRVHLQLNNPLQRDSLIAKMLEKRIGKNGTISEVEYNDILAGMFAPVDRVQVVQMIRACLVKETIESAPALLGGSSTSGSSLSPTTGSMNSKHSPRRSFSVPPQKTTILFANFVNILLDFQYQIHRDYVAPILPHFKVVDTQGTGLIKEQQFVKLYHMMKSTASGSSSASSSTPERFITDLFQRFDPHKEGVVTWSECLKVFEEDLKGMMMKLQAQQQQQQAQQQAGQEKSAGKSPKGGSHIQQQIQKLNRSASTPLSTASIQQLQQLQQHRRERSKNDDSLLLKYLESSLHGGDELAHSSTTFHHDAHDAQQSSSSSSSEMVLPSALVNPSPSSSPPPHDYQPIQLQLNGSDFSPLNDEELEDY